VKVDRALQNSNHLTLDLMTLTDCQVPTIRFLRNGQVPDHPSRSGRPVPSARLFDVPSRARLPAEHFRPTSVNFIKKETLT
jgi:hypothetical protein